MERVRQFAPQAFRRQERAVTTKDWADVAQRDSSVQRAVAQYRWTGSWHTAFVAVDRRGGAAVKEDPRFLQQFESQMERYRLAGYDLEINSPVLVSLDIEIHLCVEPGYFRSDVKEAVLERFDALVHRDGTRGFFHPDRFTFGQPVYLSRIYEAATNVPGVQSVRVVRFQRYGKLPANEIADGFIAMSSFEVARCDNDPSFPESGRFEVQAEGGL
jgi:predicted phage baseplate assembly protein